MKDKWLVTLEIDTYDGDPRTWDWNHPEFKFDDSVVKILISEFKGRVLPDGQ